MNNLLRSILETQSESENSVQMEELILETLKGAEIAYRRDTYGNIYTVIDEALPLIVAHMDTVHEIQEGQPNSRRDRRLCHRYK